MERHKKISAKVKKSPAVQKSLTGLSGVRMTMEDMINAAANATKSSKDKILEIMAEKLFDIKSILMISRLNQELSYYLTKHLIVRNFFAEVYQCITITWTTKPLKEPPYYMMAVDYQTEGLFRKMQGCYDRFIVEICSLSISFEGKSRDEILAWMKSTEVKQMQEEIQSKQGTLGRILD